MFGILNTAAVAAKIRTIEVTNTTATAMQFEVVQFTGGTAGSTVTAFPTDLGILATPTCLAKQLWTADATVVKTGHGGQLAAAIGAGVILPFGDNGLRAALGSTLGIGIVPIGTGQICHVFIEWDE
jgi:hypothetical protein